MVHDIAKRVATLNQELQESLETFQVTIYEGIDEVTKRMESSTEVIKEFSSRFEETAASVEEETAIIMKLQEELEELVKVTESLRKRAVVIHSLPSAES